MKNVAMQIDQEKKILTITVDLAKDFGESKSGKSITIASTEGNVSLEGKLADVKVGLNVYRSK